MTLAQWLEANEIKPSSFAERLGVPASTVQRWVNGDRTPRIQAILLIEQQTGGEVRAEDWRPSTPSTPEAAA